MMMTTSRKHSQEAPPRCCSRVPAAASLPAERPLAQRLCGSLLQTWTRRWVVVKVVWTHWAAAAVAWPWCLVIGDDDLLVGN